MAKTKRPSPLKEYSPRSQRSYRRQHELEEKLANLRAMIVGEERKLATAKENRDRYGRMVVNPKHLYERQLDDSLREIADRKSKIQVYNGIFAEVQTEIESFEPMPTRVAERAHKQRELACLTRLRVTHDGRIDEAIVGLRKLLVARAELTASIVRLAAEIDFERTDFDGERFAALLAVLPTAMQPESARWRLSFLGAEPDRRPCEIRRAIQIFPETLPAAHFYRRGEIASLTEAQRAEASAEERREFSAWELDQSVQSSTKEPSIDARTMPGSGILYTG